MIHLKPLERTQVHPSTLSIFLAGSIEMGKAEKWQDKLVDIIEAEFGDEDVVVFNPRRDDWDSSWIQDPTPGTQFHDQVSWELEHINKADLVVFYFDPRTQSPITLMELGYVVGSGKQAMVCCPDGYFRKGNVVITSELTRIPVVNEFDELVSGMRKWISNSLPK